MRRWLQAAECKGEWRTGVNHYGQWTCMFKLKALHMCSITFCTKLSHFSTYTRPVARICRRGVTWMLDVYVHIHKHARLGGSGGMSPQKIFEIRCSEIASEATLGQKQSRSSRYTWFAQYCIQFLVVHVCIC